jgi:hypothetical protein
VQRHVSGKKKRRGRRCGKSIGLTKYKSPRRGFFVGSVTEQEVGIR